MQGQGNTPNGMPQNNGQQAIPNGMTMQQYQQMMQQRARQQQGMQQQMPQQRMPQQRMPQQAQNMRQFNQGMPNGQYGQQGMPNGQYGQQGMPNGQYGMYGQQGMPNGMYGQQGTPNNMYGQQGMYAQQGMPQNNGVGGYVPPNDFNFESDFDTTPKKKKSKFLLILIIIAVLFVAALVVRKINMSKKSVDEFPVEETEGTGAEVDATAQQGSSLQLTGNAYENLVYALNNYDAYAIDECVGAENGDSYLAQEWAYANEVQLKQEFIQKVCSQVAFSSASGGAVTATVPDYAQVTESILADKDYIAQLYASAKLDEKTDYTFDEDCYKLFCQWILDRGYQGVPLPSKEVSVRLVSTQGPNGKEIIMDDGELDNALFATEDLHKAMKAFSQICVKFDGKGYETYTEKQEVHNPDYDEWYAVFKKYYDEDGGHFDPKKSKWEPWYVRDENNNLVYDENGEKIVNYYSVKDENGNDWIQPAEKILEEVELEREIEMPWEEERGIPYGIVGTYYIQHDYNGVYDTVFRVGDGSIERPAGFGTPIVTYMKGIDGGYHAIKVALTGYWVQQEAIDYEEAFSNKNRGFSVSSPVQLICFEFTVENLEDEAFAFNGTEMCLCNKNANVSNRTGTLYGFYDKGILEPHKRVKLNDWYSSTELQQKYVAWGRTFGRTYPLVYFDCLAGTGEIPTYSAYTQYCGKPEITEASEDYEE